MNSDVKDTKTLLSEAEEKESVGDRLGYEKDNKERMPWGALPERISGKRSHRDCGTSEYTL